MKEAIISLFQDNPQLAIYISILLSIIVAVLGLVPSVFITAANIIFFGFWEGTLISFIGEAIGAMVAFVLYRKGFKKTAHGKLEKFPKLIRLIDAEGTQAFMLVLALRLIPFVPSGLVTFAAAIGKISLPVFFIASSIGKLPALLIEAYSAYQVTEFGWQGKIILLISAVVLLYVVMKKKAAE